MTPRHHRIRSVEFSNGFLKGLRFEFADGLNCIIGGRGTGKTTLLEAIRYGLDRLPDPDKARDRHRNLERLLDSNLAGGHVRLDLETRSGGEYVVRREAGERPRVVDGEGEPCDVRIGHDLVFGADVFSQNEIEAIASDPHSQLELLDRFLGQDLVEIEDELTRVARSLERSVLETLRDTQRIADLQEETRELADLRSKLKELRVEGSDERAETLRAAHEERAAREKEARLRDSLGELYQLADESLASTRAELEREHALHTELELPPSPNRELVDAMRARARDAVDAATRALTEAQADIRAARGALDEQADELAARHAKQERVYHEALEALAGDQSKARERARLEKRLVELEERRRRQQALEAAVEARLVEREELRARLSELRDRRYGLRLGVANRLSERLAPMIRIRVEPYANAEDYAGLLKGALKGSGLRYAPLVDAMVKRLPPAELVELVQGDRLEDFARRLDVPVERANKLLLLLKDTEAIAKAETVDLHDLPIIELRDGQDYKVSAELSTGQKCTTILPILLLESERPLLIDQPEDNLDNAFVFDTIVHSLRAIRGKRQLIFVTHNPNVPVLGEAERVFVLRSTGRMAQLHACGDVDTVREEIEAILEGGSEAFKLRMKRYGY